MAVPALGIAFEHTGDTRSPVDEDWDGFVAGAPGGHHLQATLWSRVKEVVGWGARRVVVRDGSEIVGGCQLLLRRVGPAGAIGFCPRGPVLRESDPVVLRAVIDGLQTLAREERAAYIKLQPPASGYDLGPSLEALGFVPSSLEAAPVRTVRVDLGPPPARLLAATRRSVRSNIRKAVRKGVTVRAGGPGEMAEFWRIIEATSRRQGFTPYPRAYYERMREAFAPGGHARLLLAEHRGRVHATSLLIGYGDSAIFKMGGWDGQPGAVHPNELLHWSGMLWAREQGYRFYDLEGIDGSTAARVGQGIRRPPHLDGRDHFKLGFGGEVTDFPGPYDFTYVSLLEAPLRFLAPRLDRLRPLADRVLGRTC
jgi:lipid II:glycine glycyltransferase (peptidoglycan interpeptide bridge formation enzyme)